MARYSLDDLMEYISPSVWRTNGLDWQRSEQSVDSPLPADYERFMRTFGPGGIAGYLVIEPPVAIDATEGLMSHGMIPPPREMLEDMESPYPAFPESGGLIYLGGDSSGDVIFYRADGDPDNWSIVVRRRHHGFAQSGWKAFDCGLVDFLMRMFRGEFDENPLGSNDLWCRGPDDVAFQSSLA